MRWALPVVTILSLSSGCEPQTNSASPTGTTDRDTSPTVRRTLTAADVQQRIPLIDRILEDIQRKVIQNQPAGRYADAFSLADVRSKNGKVVHYLFEGIALSQCGEGPGNLHMQVSVETDCVLSAEVECPEW
jgi:hypothetical protein